MQKGQTLIEVLVALSVAVVVISSITVSVLTALSNTTFIKSQTLATQYANQGNEIVRAMRNSDFASFQVLKGSYCLSKTCVSLSNGTPTDTVCGPKLGLTCGQNVDTFVRQVDISPPNNSATDCNSVAYKVKTTVFWADGKCSQSNLFCHSVVLTTCLSDYQIVPGL